MLKKLAYSAGAIATALSYQAFSTYILFFYVDTLKLPIYLAGVAMLVYGIWNAFNDPLLGFLSDRTRTRWGRRIPYLLGGAVPFGLAFCLLWVPPFEGIEQTGSLLAYFIVMICLFDGLYTMTVLNWAALFPEMYRSLGERAQVNALRQSFGLVGLLLGIALPPLLYSTYGWPSLGLVFGWIISLVVIVAAWGSRERQEYVKDRPLGFWTALKTTARNRSFGTFVTANLFSQYTFTLILATIPFFAKYVLRADPAGVTGILAAAFLVAIPMLFVWKAVAVRIGAKKTMITAMVCLAGALAPLLMISDYGLVVLTAGAIGAALAGFLLSADLLIADVIDEDEVKTGVRREGMYFGLNAFITRFAIGLEAFSMSTVFIASGYNPYVFTQYGEFNNGLRWLIAGLPIIALGLGCGMMLLYPLAGKRLEEMRGELAAVQARKGIV
ncbi:MAG: MFS transporter [Candidatus Margulisbacteria bacterium]|nr:MFS transporter [Candidatus Margulisiibacteriota bacterium]